MKNNDLTKSALVALLLFSTAVVAEDKYPASDFQPKVLYQDESAAKQTESSSPAKSTSSSISSSSDSKYPAANFEPKVLYADESYKHTAQIPSSGSSSSSQSSSTESIDSSGNVTTAAAQEESSMGYLLGLVVLAVAGFVLFKKGAGANKSSTSRASTVVRAAGGLTGVARYVLKASGTGVSRYLDKQAKNAPVSAAATGVAKYLASQTPSAKSTASDAVTGVEKYMRKKG